MCMLPILYFTYMHILFRDFRISSAHSYILITEQFSFSKAQPNSYLKSALTGDGLQGDDVALSLVEDLDGYTD